MASMILLSVLMYISERRSILEIDACFTCSAFAFTVEVSHRVRGVFDQTRQGSPSLPPPVNAGRPTT